MVPPRLSLRERPDTRMTEDEEPELRAAVMVSALTRMSRERAKGPRHGEQHLGPSAIEGREALSRNANCVD
jgi:hypothetical protein